MTRRCNDPQTEAQTLASPVVRRPVPDRRGAAMSGLEHFFEILAAARRGELNGGDYSLIVVGAALALAETGSGDSFESLHEAASRSTKHIFQNRAHRVDAPSPQSASERRKGITTTQEDV